MNARETYVTQDGSRMQDQASPATRSPITIEHVVQPLGEWTQQSGWIRHLPVQCRYCWWLCLSGYVVLWSEEQGDTLLSLSRPWVKTTHVLSTGNHSPELSEMHLRSQLKGIQQIGVGASSEKNQLPNVHFLNRTIYRFAIWTSRHWGMYNKAWSSERKFSRNCSA